MKKANRKWQMFIDFMDLNNVCIKDSHALSYMMHWWIAHQDMGCSISWILIQDTIKNKCIQWTGTRWRSWSRQQIIVTVMTFNLTNVDAIYQHFSLETQSEHDFSKLSSFSFRHNFIISSLKVKENGCLLFFPFLYLRV